MKKVFSFDNCLNTVTGVHKVLMDIHEAIKDTFDAKILGTLEYRELHSDLHIKEEEYQKIGTFLNLRNSILIVHQRRLAIKYNIISLLPFMNLKVVYVHHNILKGQRWITFLPQKIITISEKCIENLTDYFRVPRKNITKIHNAVVDKNNGVYYREREGLVKILYTATVYPVKRQIQLVNYLADKLNDNVQIIFAGEGTDLKELQRITKNDSRFKCLGFVSNIDEMLAKVDYCMLFSEHEGLPISLIEATMMGVPIICNDVGGNLEIVRDGYNGFVCNDWTSLVERLNSLVDIPNSSYDEMCGNSRLSYERYFTFERFKTRYIEYLSKL